MATDGVTPLDAAHVPDKTADDTITGKWKFNTPIGTIGGFNFTANGDFEKWSAGASAAPDNWAVSGSSASIAQNSSQVKIGSYSATLTSGASAKAWLNQVVDSLAGAPGASWWRGKTVTFAAWVRTSLASIGRLHLYDGVADTVSAYHTGSNSYEFLTVTRTMDAAATELTVGLEVAAGSYGVQIDGAILVLGAGIQDWIPSGLVSTTDVSPYALSDLTGLTLSNNGVDPTNDIDITAGAAVSDDGTIANRVLLSLTASLTKQLDAVWAAGSAAGMRDSGDTLSGAATFHLYLFRRSGGQIDIFASTSLTPTLPDGGTKQRRIGSILWSGSAIRPFVQDRDLFQLKTPILDHDVTNPGTAAVLRALTVPTGFSVRAIFHGVYGSPGSASIGRAYFSDPAVTDLSPSGTAAPLWSVGNNESLAELKTSVLVVRTDTSGRVRSRADTSSASHVLRMATLGWIDHRGRG